MAKKVCAERLLRMKVLQGKSVFQGMVAGRLFFYDREADAVNRNSGVEENARISEPDGVGVLDVAAQLSFWKQAKETVCRKLEKLCEENSQTIGETYAAIFEMQKMLLEDEGLVSSVQQMIEHEKCTAVEAVKRAGERAARQLLQAEDAYIRERAQDVKDITAQLLDSLAGRSGNVVGEEACDTQERTVTREQRRQEDTKDAWSDKPVILIARELFPGELAGMRRDEVAGIVLCRGSLADHTAILAKGFGIPMVVQAGTALPEELAGKEAVLDAGEGTLYVEPDEETKRVLLLRQEMCKNEERSRAEACKEQQQPEKDGNAAVNSQHDNLKIYANAGTLQEIELAVQNGAEGIGLFRSEFLYMECKEAPGEELLTDFYRRVLEVAKGREVIVRTFDLGSDKQVTWLENEREKNPALGMRGIRLALAHEELLRTQLKALYRAARYGRLSVMYPMISSLEELRKVKEVEREAKTELEKEGVSYERNVSTGIMIETPAAALLSKELAKEADFFSVGTNDLTQYTLAADRQNTSENQLTDSESRAVFQLIRMTAENAHEAGIKVSVCGEMASEPAFLSEFVKTGIDVLSVSAALVPKIRQKV